MRPSSRHHAVLACLVATALSACKSKPPKVAPHRPDVAGSASGPIGTRASVVVKGVDPEGRWVVFCQPNREIYGTRDVEVVFGLHGETSTKLGLYLAFDRGLGQAIGDYFGHDSSGRWLVIGKHERLWLLDVELGTKLDLSALGAVIVGNPNDPHFSAPVSFDEHGRLLYLRKQGRGIVFVLRELETGAEREIAPGKGRVVTARLHDNGAWIVYWVGRRHQRCSVLRRIALESTAHDRALVARDFGSGRRRGLDNRRRAHPSVERRQVDRAR